MNGNERKWERENLPLRDNAEIGLGESKKLNQTNR
jgi:hypothetical protein